VFLVARRRQRSACLRHSLDFNMPILRKNPCLLQHPTVESVPALRGQLPTLRQEIPLKSLGRHEMTDSRLHNFCRVLRSRNRRPATRERAVTKLVKHFAKDESGCDGNRMRPDRKPASRLPSSWSSTRWDRSKRARQVTALTCSWRNGGRCASPEIIGHPHKSSSVNGLRPITWGRLGISAHHSTSSSGRNPPPGHGSCAITNSSLASCQWPTTISGSTLSPNSGHPIKRRRLSFGASLLPRVHLIIERLQLIRPTLQTASRL
jgi:hypothetical protein